MDLRTEAAGNKSYMYHIEINMHWALLPQTYLSIIGVAQLSLRKGGLGLRSLSLHSPAAFIASLCSGGYGSHSTLHLSQAINMFNYLVTPSDGIKC